MDFAEAQESCRGPVLVTGGTGFLGRRIVDRLLALGRQVSVAARRPAPDLEVKEVATRDQMRVNDDARNARGTQVGTT